jgi:hypothetical protein
MKNKNSALWYLLVILLSLSMSGSVQAKTDNVLTPSATSIPALNSGIPIKILGSNTGTALSFSSSQTVRDKLISFNDVISSTKGINNKSGLSSLSLPIRAAFYYPWFPEAWTQNSIYPYSNYQPSSGYYDLANQEIIRQQISAMLYGHIDAGIASWWGQGSTTDNRLPALLTASIGTPFKWSIYYEPESFGNPDVSTLTADLTYLRDKYSSNPGFLRIDNRFVVFVYADTNDGCGMVDRWHQANTVNAYIVLKVFPGYQACSNQPNGWHQYSPAKAVDSQGKYSYTISPGFWKVGENPRLERDLLIWQQSARDMVASGADFQLITTFNEWGEGTAVESAGGWNTLSGFGAYLDALHDTGLVYKVFLPTILNATPAITDPVVVAAGDIASCNSTGDEQTAALLDKMTGTVITLGDNVYESGTINEFNTCYAPTWGRQKTRTFPSVGNHEYKTIDAAGYYDYFGAAAGDPTKGYYSYDIGAWHIIVMNTNCSEIGGCGVNSPQVVWLRTELAAHPALCTLAYWHQPRFSSGEHGNDTAVQPIWQALYDAGVELVLNGHDHDYERFAPQNPDGVADPINGIREFVVGTGGKDLRSIGSPINNSEVQNANTWGVLKLTLHPDSYDWQFIPIAGKTFTDSGSGNCH